MSVKSNFTFDIIIFIHDDSEKNCFLIFLCPKFKMVRPGFNYMTNAMTTTQKQSDYEVEQSSFTLIALFDLKLVVVKVIIGLMETRLYQMKMTDNLENRPETIPPSYMISRWVSVTFTRYHDMVTTVFYFLQVIQTTLATSLYKGSKSH